MLFFFYILLFYYHQFTCNSIVKVARCRFAGADLRCAVFMFIINSVVVLRLKICGEMPFGEV